MPALLLDTRTLLWWLAGDTKLPRRARAAIADESNDVFVSAASAWEIAINVRLETLPAPSLGGSGLARAVAAQGFQQLDITLAHAERAGSLPGEHRDPFDRMLIAQAQAEALTIVSNERVFDAYGVVRLW